MRLIYSLALECARGLSGEVNKNLCSARFGVLRQYCSFVLFENSELLIICLLYLYCYPLIFRFSFLF